MEFAGVKPFCLGWITNFRIAVDNQVLIEEERASRVNPRRCGPGPTSQYHVYRRRCIVQICPSFSERQIPTNRTGKALSWRVGVAPLETPGKSREVIKELLSFLALVRVGK